MGQIVGGAAKPKRCNLSKLSQLETPAAGVHILVSSDNSMNAAGQGNFDCYIVGDGKTAAIALPLIKTYANDVDEQPIIGSGKLVTSGGVAETMTDKKYVFGGNLSVLPESIISAQIKKNTLNELIASPTTRTAKIAFFKIIKGHNYTITIPKPYTWQYTYGYCDTILSESPTEDTNLGGIINSGSYVGSSTAAITKEIHSEKNGYYFVGFNGTGGIPTIIDNIEGTENAIEVLRYKEEEIKDAIYVGSRILLTPLYKDGMILQSTVIQANANIRTFFVPAKLGDIFNIVSFSNTSLMTGFTEFAPEINIGVTDYYASNDYNFYGRNIVSPINGYFCVSINNTYNAPTIYKLNKGVGENVTTNAQNIVKINNALHKVISEELQAQVIDGYATPLNANVGSPLQLVENSNRKTLKIDIENLSGTLSAPVYGVASANNCVCITNSDDVIIGYVDINYKSWYTSKCVDLDEYEDAKYAYITSGGNYNSAFHINNSSLNPKSFSDTGTIVLHFDGGESSINGTFYSRRKQIVDSYGWKASFCISLNMLNADGTDWASNAIKDEYWSLVKDGWTPMLYPSVSATVRDEEQWNAWMDATLAKFANVGVYNITTFACGNLAVNDDLLNACIKHDFKIIRGGGVGSDNSYVYRPENYNCPQVWTNKKNFVLAAAMIGGDHDEIQSTVKDAIDNAVQMRGARAMFSHVAYEELPSGDTTNVSEACLIKVFDYIKSLETQGKIQVMNMDELYNNLNPPDGISWCNGRAIKMSQSN